MKTKVMEVIATIFFQKKKSRGFYSRTYGNPKNLLSLFPSQLKSGPIPESKGMGAIFQKKDKMFENLGKNVQYLKIF